MDAATKKKPFIMTLTVDPNDLASNWQTVLFNCNCHTFDEVTDQIIKAIACTREKADHIAYSAHKRGNEIVCTGNRGYCENAARVLGDIGLVVTVIQG